MALMPPHRWLCLCLRSGDEHTDELGRVLETGRLNWPGVLYRANQGLVITSLASTLARRQLLSLVPAEVRDYLSTLLALNTERNRLLRRHLLHIGERFNRIGVQPLVLKGARDLLSDPLEESQGARLMGDLDLLVPRDSLDACTELLIAQGYRPQTGHSWENHHHTAPLLHSTEPVKIELHRHIVYTAWQALLPTDGAWQIARPLTVDGIALHVLPPTSQAIHLLVHAQLGYYALTHQTLQLRQMLDLVVLRHHHEANIDWSLVGQRFQAVGQTNRMMAYLVAAQRLFDQPLPMGFAISPKVAWQSRQLVLTAQHLAAARWLRRLGRLPRRLLTPSWYPMKIRALQRGMPW
ncbi:MAG TPA: nucleotidyltransferase family protein [Candidatus Competibacter sp.]|nr:nucleotidyltransferase family protein [Candidatus Competibacteraceae bacterium]HPE70979.1 nucleotidyltransferase family protein [Candidatus Competibacter sp.]